MVGRGKFTLPSFSEIWTPLFLGIKAGGQLVGDGKCLERDNSIGHCSRSILQGSRKKATVFSKPDLSLEIMVSDSSAGEILSSILVFVIKRKFLHGGLLRIRKLDFYKHF